MACASRCMTDGELWVMIRKTGMSATQHWWREGDHPLVPETESTGQPRTKAQESLPGEATVLFRFSDREIGLMGFSRSGRY